VFVAFEGIDGSGKSAIAERVAEALRARGLSVRHVREGGVLASALAEEIRSMCRAPEHMAMRPITELLLYAAREVQLLEEAIAPALGENDVVIADRSMCSWRVLARWGRGLDAARVDTICAAATAGLEPDLLVLLDVDPHLARSRRRAQKIRNRGVPRQVRAGGRKGLAGAALNRRLRRGYLELAGADPARWLIVDNTAPDNDLAALAAEIAAAIAERQSGRPAPPLSVETPAPRPPPTGLTLADLIGWAGERFFALVEARAAAEPDVAAYWLAGIDEPRADELRRRLAAFSPEVVAAALRGLASNASWELRRALAGRAPIQVADSLGGRRLRGDARAMELCHRLIAGVPDRVLASLAGDDSDEAWTIRDRLASDHLTAVVASTREIDGKRAWELRERLLGGDDEAAVLVARSLRGIDTDRAWAIRDRIATSSPLDVIKSLGPIESERAWTVREERAASAPRAVFASLAGSDHPRAWALRRRFAASVKEVVDSIAGLAAAPAWHLREEAGARWPSTVVKSMRDLDLDERGEALAATLIADGPGDVSLLGHALRLRRRSF
jgi:dTMP kinase